MVPAALDSSGCSEGTVSVMLSRSPSELVPEMTDSGGCSTGTVSVTLSLCPSELVPAAPDSRGCSEGTVSLTSSISPGPAVLVPIRADSGGFLNFLKVLSFHFLQVHTPPPLLLPQQQPLEPHWHLWTPGTVVVFLSSSSSSFCPS